MADRPVVLVALGTRPEAVKLAPLIYALRRKKSLRTVVVGTAQHRRLLDQTLAAFSLRLDHDLDLMRPGQTPGQVFERVARALGPLLTAYRPRLVLVQGDTTTALASALAASTDGRPVGHVEAGVRSHDPLRPFPEEINRILIDRVCDLLFAPTEGNRTNLLQEGIPGGKIEVTGNTGVDALLRELHRPHRWSSRPLARFLERTRDRPLALLTAHRRESIGRPLAGILDAVRTLLKRRTDLRLVCPVHPNPKVRTAVSRALKGPRVLLLPGLDYPDFIRLMKRAELLLTDSGGAQEEAPTLGTPVVILRDVTDRPEGLKAGEAVLAGTRPEAIVRLAEKLLDGGRPRRARPNPFGDGRASDRIVRGILRFLKEP